MVFHRSNYRELCFFQEAEYRYFLDSVRPQPKVGPTRERGYFSKIKVRNNLKRSGTILEGRYNIDLLSDTTYKDPIL